MRKLSLHLLQVLVRNVRTNECLIYISTTGQTVKFYAIGEIHFKMVLSTVDTFLPTYLPRLVGTRTFGCTKAQTRILSELSFG